MASSNAFILPRSSPYFVGAAAAMQGFTESLMYYRREHNGCVSLLPRTSVLQLVLSPIPVGAPWWETGWPIYELVLAAERSAAAEARMSPRALWRALHRASRVFANERRRDPAYILFEEKARHSLAIVSNLVAQIRSISATDGPNLGA